jgi:hypothetical protein
MHKRQRLARFLFFAAGTVFLSAASAWATSAVERTFSDLVSHAEVIAIGTVTDIADQWDAEQQAPRTLVTFSNVTVLKGTANNGRLVLHFLGGRTPAGVSLTIPGVPHFTVGEKNIVFCAGNQRDFCPLVGLWQGRLRVAFDPQRGVETVSDNFRAPLVGIRDGKFLRRGPDTALQEALSLPEIIQFIQQELRRGYDR